MSQSSRGIIITKPNISSNKLTTIRCDEDFKIFVLPETFDKKSLMNLSQERLINLISTYPFLYQGNGTYIKEGTYLAFIFTTNKAKMESIKIYQK